MTTTHDYAGTPSSPEPQPSDRPRPTPGAHYTSRSSTVLPATALDQRIAHVVARQDHRLEQRRQTLQHVISGRLSDNHLSYPQAQAVSENYQKIGAVISQEEAAGATRHRRLPWFVRILPALVAVIDWIVLVTFCAVVFNVDLTHPLQYPVATLASGMLAFLAAGVSYVWLTVTGRRIREFRDPLGEIMWGIMGWTTKAMVSVSLVLVAALSTLMFLRVHGEVVGAGGGLSAGSPVVLAVIFAVLSAVGNLTVTAVHALDGSALAERQRHLGRVLRRHEKLVHKRRQSMLKLQTPMTHTYAQPPVEVPMTSTPY